jgi:hypothetical protein
MIRWAILRTAGDRSLRQAVVGCCAGPSGTRRLTRPSGWPDPDGTGAARSTRPGCHYCLPIKNQGEITGHNHKFSLACLTASGLVLPADIEPYSPGGGELAASRKMLRRLVGNRTTLAQYVVWIASMPMRRLFTRQRFRVIRRRPAEGESSQSLCTGSGAF